MTRQEQAPASPQDDGDPNLWIDQHRALHAAARRLAIAAFESYQKHCGHRAVECAESDLLGEALSALRRVGISRVERPAIGGTFIHHGWHCEVCGADWEGAQVPQRHSPECVLAKASGERT